MKYINRNWLSFYKTFLIVLILSGLTIRSSAQKMRIISYNILEGMKMDTTTGKQQFVEWVKQQDPDILALQECNKFKQATLEKMARQYNHPYAVLLREPGYPVAITSKYPIVDVRKVTDNMHHGFIVAKIKDINVIVLHFSPHNYEKRKEEVEVILSTIAASSSQQKWAIMGDFNSYSPLDKEHYKDGRLMTRLLENAKKYSFHNNLVDGKALDYSVQQRILDFGLKDSFYLNKSKKYELNGSLARIDYVYVSKDLAPRISVARTLKDAFTSKFSDHLPVLVELQ